MKKTHFTTKGSNITVTITDMSDYGLGLIPQTKGNKYVDLGFGKTIGFYLFVNSNCINAKQAVEMQNELKAMSVIMAKADTLLNKPKSA